MVQLLVKGSWAKLLKAFSPQMSKERPKCTTFSILQHHQLDSIVCTISASGGQSFLSALWIYRCLGTLSLGHRTCCLSLMDGYGHHECSSRARVQGCVDRLSTKTVYHRTTMRQPISNQRDARPNTLTGLHRQTDRQTGRQTDRPRS